MKTNILASVVIFSVLFTTHHAFSQNPFPIDLSFTNGGILGVPHISEQYDFQSDGTMIGAYTIRNGDTARFYIIAYDNNGNVKQSFGQNGLKEIFQFVSPSGYGTASEVYELKVTTNNKIVVTGSSFTCSPAFCNQYLRRAFISRLNSDGSFDFTFDFDGIKTKDYFQLPSNGHGNYSSLTLRQNSKILYHELEYSGTTFGYQHNFKQLNSDGSVDISFGNFGVLPNLYTLGGEPGYILADSNFIIHSGVFNGSPSLINYTNFGSLITSFGNSGFIQLPFQQLNSPIKYDLSGRIYAIQNVVISPDPVVKIAISRFSHNGFLDPTFGNSGVKIISTINSLEMIDFFVQSNNQVLLYGSRTLGNLNRDNFLMKLDEFGNEDFTFGSDGLYIIDSAGQRIWYRPDGKILIDKNNRIIRLNNNTVSGIAHSADDDELFIFPNPAQEFLDIKNKGKIELLSFYDINGKLLKSFNRNELMYERIDISDFKNAFYFVKVKFTTGLTKTEKILVNKG